MIFSKLICTIRAALNMRDVHKWSRRRDERTCKRCGLTVAVKHRDIKRVGSANG